MLLLMLTLLVGGGCVLGAWGAVQPSEGRFVDVGALDVRVVDVGVGKRLITYHMDRDHNGWQTRIIRRLTDQGWRAPTELYTWGSTEQYASIYTQRTTLWRLTVWEQARLDGDAWNARITVRRWVEWR